jgi:hypothetical protein
MFKAHSTPWVCLGRTTAWPDEDNPPDPTPGTEEIEEAIVFVKPGRFTLCKQVESGGDVTVDGVKLAFVDDANAYTENARFLFIETVFDTSIHPHANYRQKGVFTDLTPAAGHETDDWLAPSDVSDRGVLEYLAHKTVKSFGAGETRIERTVIEFR